MKSLLFHGRGCLAAAVAMLILSGAAYANPVQFFNTGVDGSGAVLINGATTESHYTLVLAPLGSTSSVLVRTSVGGFPIPPWIADNSLSAWIGPNNAKDLTGPTGNYDYQTTFDLSGFDPTTLTIVGRWATDNTGLDILVNGASTGNSIPFGIAPDYSFGAWTPFTISSGFFTSGLNTLDFVVNNDAGPTGLRVEMTGTADPIPEPASLLLIGAGLAALGIFRRRLA